jgi:fumarate reductase subunit C
LIALAARLYAFLRNDLIIKEEKFFYSKRLSTVFMIIGILWMTFIILIAFFPNAKMRNSPNKYKEFNYNPILIVLSMISISILYIFRKKNFESVKPIKKRFEKK